MSIEYLYAVNGYSSLAEVDEAVSNLKQRLDNNPNDWCYVKTCTGNDTDGWLIQGGNLTDDQIQNPDTSLLYSVNSTVTGDNGVGLTSSQMTEKVIEIRRAYANYLSANTIFITEGDSTSETAPSNENMNVYVE